jgi:hypothetical protein
MSQFVALTPIIGVFGGTLCASTYSNGDKVPFQAGSTAYFDPPTWRPVPA